MAHTHARTRRHPTGTGTRSYPWPLAVIAAPAAVAIWSGWVGLGSLCGFGVIHPLPGIADGLRIDTDITLPVGIEAYGAYALYVWLGGRGSDRTRIFAKKSAIGALILGCLGQVAFHLLSAAHWTAAPWPVVVFVACLPVATLFFAAALVHMIRADARTAEQEREARERAAAEAEQARAERAAARAEAKRTGTPAGTRKRKPVGTTTRNRKPATPEPQAEPESVPEAEPEEAVSIDAEARILQAISQGQLDPETAILQLVAAGRSPSKAGILAGRSDSYGRQVVRKAKELAASAPEGPDAGEPR